MIQLALSVGADCVWIKQTVFTWPGKRLIDSIPNRKWHAEQGAFSFPIAQALAIYNTVQGAGTVALSDEFRDLLAKARHANRTTVPEPVITDYKFKLEPFAPYAHQVRMFDFGRKRRHFAYLAEMGTGKSRATVDVLSYWMQTERIDGALILCPKAVLFNWERELAMWSPLAPERRRTVVLTGTSAQKKAALSVAEMSAGFVITNYETLLNLHPELKALLVRRKFAVVCDESTRIKSHKGEASKQAYQLGMVAEARVILTGSPIANGPLDAWAQFRFLHPDILGHQSFTSFKAEFAVTTKRQNIPVPIVVGYRNLDRLNKLIEPHAFRILKEDCLDLPAKVYRTVELQMGPKQAELYKRMKEEAVIEIEGRMMAAPIVLTRLMRLQQITSGFVPQLDDYGNELATYAIEDAVKMDACLDLIRTAIESGQKVCVWCRFLWEIHAIEAAMAEEKIEAVCYYGDVSAENRQVAVDAIQTGSAKVFIGQIATAGIGITLTAISTCIYYSNSFSLEHRLQSEDRHHRIGQKRSVEYIDLVCLKTVDKHVLAALREKKNVADIVTGDARKMLEE